MAEPRRDLRQVLAEQLELLEDYATQYDAGKPLYAKSMATGLRVLLHNTGQSHALLDQLGMKDAVSWLDDTLPVFAGNIGPTWNLVMLRGTAQADGSLVPTWMPVLGDGPPIPRPRLAFERWWTDTVAIDLHRHEWSRKDLVMMVANKDGGAHVDPALPEAYAALSRENAFAGATLNDGVATPAPDPVPACIRQITFEVLESIRRVLD